MSNTGTYKFGIDIYAIKEGTEVKVKLLNNKGHKKIKLINFLIIFTCSCISNYTLVSMRDFRP